MLAPKGAFGIPRRANGAPKHKWVCRGRDPFGGHVTICAICYQRRTPNLARGICRRTQRRLARRAKAVK